MLTLKDIAQLAGVSSMTVSRVVNGRYDKVSDETVAKVQGIIKEHGYVPNSSARSLASKSTRLIAIIIQSEDFALEYPYNAAMVGSLCRFVQDRGYSPLPYYVKDYSEVTERLHSWSVEGAVFLGMFDEDMRNLQRDNTMPLVFTDSYSKTRQVINIGLDDYKGGELAAQYLTDMGHSKIAFLGASTEISSIVRQRYYGMRDTLMRRGLPLPEGWSIFNKDYDGAVRELFAGDDRPTAVFASADIDAVRLMELLRQMDMRVPEDCSVIGFDNLFFGKYTTPRLTTISQDIRRKAQLATEVLFRHIEDSSIPAENIILDVELVERESVCRLK